MKSLTLTLLAVSVAPPALFGQSSWGVDAIGTVASRSDVDNAGLEEPLNNGTADSGGGAGWQSDFASGDDERGSFLSSGTLLNDLGAFIKLSTYAASSSQEHPAAAINASVTAVETFFFEGTEATRFTLWAGLDGAFSNSPNNPSPEAGSFGDVTVLRGSATDLSFSFSTDLGDWIAAGLEPMDTVHLELSDATTMETATIEVLIHPGEIFYVFAQSSSRMFGPDGIADSSSTLTVGLRGDTFGLSSLSGAGDLIMIPEPRSLALVVALLSGGFIGLRRRR